MYKYSLKNGSKVSKPKIWIFMQISFFFSYEIPTLWSSENNEAILEKVKVAE